MLVNIFVASSGCSKVYSGH